MEYYIGLVFPETPDEILQLGADKSALEGMLDDLALLRKSLIQQGFSFTFIYDSQSLNQFINSCQYLDKDVYWTKANMLLRNIIGTHSQDVYRYNHISKLCQYKWWNIISCNVEDISNVVKEVVERELEEEGHSVLVTLSNDDKYGRDIIPVIKDAIHITTLPRLLNVPCFQPIISSLDWFNHRLDKKSFTLCDTSKFKRTNYIYHPTRQRIYQEIETDNYWYFDFFHKDCNPYFEVFDSQTFCHIREVDEFGNDIPNSKDLQKNIKKYIR